MTKYKLPNLDIEACQERLDHDQKSLDYLIKTKGLSLDTLRAFKVGLFVGRNQNVILIPIFWDGVLINYHALHAESGKYTSNPDYEPAMLNADAANGARAVRICSDPMAVMQKHQAEVPAACPFNGEFTRKDAKILNLVPKIIFQPDAVNKTVMKQLNRLNCHVEDEPYTAYAMRRGSAKANPEWLMDIARGHLTKHESQVLIAIMRKLTGFHKTEGGIPFVALQDMTDLRLDVIKTTVKSLSAKGYFDAHERGQLLYFVIKQGEPTNA